MHKGIELLCHLFTEVKLMSVTIRLQNWVQRFHYSNEDRHPTLLAQKQAGCTNITHTRKTVQNGSPGVQVGALTQEHIITQDSWARRIKSGSHLSLQINRTSLGYILVGIRTCPTVVQLLYQWIGTKLRGSAPLGAFLNYQPIRTTNKPK
jgi:hypothetical protein